MRFFQKKLSIKTKELYDFVKITDDVQEVVNESKIKNGVVFICSLHNTASIIIQENDPTIHKDLINALERMFPTNLKYEHDYEGNVNATAHLKSNFLGNSIIVPLKNGKLLLGNWQELFFIELFEPRNRQVIVTIIGE
jgi:secondary thiamine-phosphate synthase enzyme